MYKVTLKIKPNDEWVDGPSYLLSAPELTEFAKTHAYFKVESASSDDVKIHSVQIPSGFKDFLK